jgi:hypothetical protein
LAACCDQQRYYWKSKTQSRKYRHFVGHKVSLPCSHQLSTPLCTLSQINQLYARISTCLKSL